MTQERDVNSLIVDEDLLRKKLRALSSANVDDVVTALTAFSYLARIQGLLHIERFLEDIGDPVLHTLMRLVVDGTDPELVRQAADNHIRSALARTQVYLDVVRQGVNLIQHGVNARLVAELLSSVTGTPVSFHDNYPVPQPIVRGPLSQEEIDALLTAISSGDPSEGSAHSQFDDLIMALSDRDLQQVIREISSSELATALKAPPRPVLDKFLRNFSQRAATLLLEDIQFMGPVRERDIEDAQSRIVRLIRKLEDAGDIIVPRLGA